MTDKEVPERFDEVGIAPDGPLVLDDGQPRLRSQRDNTQKTLEDELDLNGSPNFRDKIEETSSFLFNQEGQKPQSSIDGSGSQASSTTYRALQRRKAAMLKNSSYSNEGIWLAFNKYLYTIVLLFMATFHLNLLGFFYFVLFIVHTFAYYSFRTTNTPFDYLLSVPRAGLGDLRPFFCYCNIIVSSMALISIIVMKLMLHMSGQDDNAFDNETQTSKGKDGSDSFSFMMKLVPDFDSLYTLFSTILAFLFSVVLFFTRVLENKENEVRETQVTFIVKSFPFSNLHKRGGLIEEEDEEEEIFSEIISENGSENTIKDAAIKKKSALKKVSLTIQDYNFKQNTLFGISFTLIGVISASTLTWINLPYQILFIVHAFFVGFSFQRCQIILQPYMSWLLRIMLTVELLTQYVFYIRGFSQDFTAKQKYQREVQGVLQNTTSFVVFALKVFLVIIECSRIQFEKHLSQLEFIQEAKTLIDSVCNKSFSFFAKLLAPISQFLFCMIALIFAFLHPSFVFVPMVPLLILSFFSDISEGKTCNVFTFSKGLFMFLAMTFTCTLYVYSLTQLHQNDTILAKWRETKSANSDTQYFMKIIGFSEINKNQQSLAMRQFLPYHFEMLFILLMVTCSKYAEIRANFLKRQLEKKKKLNNSQDQSQKLYEEAIHDDGFSSSASATLISIEGTIKDSESGNFKTEEDKNKTEIKDETLRGRFYSFFQICWSAIRWALVKGLNFSTVHSTKIAMTVLFGVTALDPNIFNALLFILFLAISMGNNSQMVTLWRISIFMISLLLISQYSLRVFASNSYLVSVRLREKNNLLCLSGFIKCEDDTSINTTYANLELMYLKQYLPYYVLLLTFIIGYYILTSENYQYLMDKYIDKEVQLQKQAKKDQMLLEDGDEISLDKESVDKSFTLNQHSSDSKNEETPNQDQTACDSNSEMRKMMKNSVLLCDPVTKIFIQNSMYLLILSMALLSTTLPLAITNVLLLIVMTILVIRALQTDTQIGLYKNSRCLLYFIKYGALITLTLRYLAQIYIINKTNERIVDPNLTNNDESDFIHISALLFGYTSDFFAVRLLSLTMILVISNMQLGMLQNAIVSEIIAEADQIESIRTRPISVFTQIKVYVVFFFYSLLPVSLLGVIFLLVAQSPSFLGLIAMFATVIILSMHQKVFWKESYKTIGTFTMIFVAVTYTLDFIIYVANDRYPEMLEQDSKSNYNFLTNAFNSNLEYFNKDQKFFTQIFWLYVILAFCFLQKRIQRYEPFFKLQQPEKPNRTQIPVIQLNNDDKSDGEQAQIQRQLEEESFISQQAIYEYEQCIRNCLWFRNEVALVFLFCHGVSLTICLCLIVMFVKNNVSSVLYLVALSYIYRVDYYPSRFRSSLDKEEHLQKRDQVNRSLRRLITLASILILIEYTVITIHNFTQESPDEQSFKTELISTWEKFVTNTFCFQQENIKDDQPSQCLTDWNNWLSIGKNAIKGEFFVSQYFLLMTAYFARHFTSNENEGIQELKILPEPVFGDEQDFTSNWNPKAGASSTNSESSQNKDFNDKNIDSQNDQSKYEQPEDKITYTDQFVYYFEKLFVYLVFGIFPYVLMSVIFLAVIKFDGISFADLIDIGFLIQCFYLLAYVKSFYAKNVSMLVTLRLYNIIVLGVLVMFQAPAFICPVEQMINTDDKPSENFYIPASECKHERVQRESGTTAWMTFYVVVAQSIGLKKYTMEGQFPWAYLLIVLCTEIQAAAFHHPYFKVYTLQELRNQKLDGRMRGFMTVENFHLNRKWAYKAIKQQMRILNDRLQRIMKEYNQIVQENWQWSTDDFRDDALERQPLKLGGLEVQGVQQKSLESARLQAIDETINDKKFIEMIEDIAMQLLVPNLPVVSIKKLQIQVKEALIEKQNSFFEVESQDDDQNIKFKKVDLEGFRELVYSQISELQRAVYRDNKIELYNKDGIGLNFALEQGCHENLDKGDDAFYYSIFSLRELHNDEEQKIRAQSEPSERGSSLGEVANDGAQSEDFQQMDHLDLFQRKSVVSSKSSYSANIGEDYIIPKHSAREKLIFGKNESEILHDDVYVRPDALEVNQDWQETIDILREKEEQIYLPFMYRVLNGMKRIILEHGTNRLIFYSLYDKKNIVKSNHTLSKVSMMTLIQALFISQAENIVFGLLFINFAQSATLINLLLPLSALFYAMLENPMPSYKYWRFVSLYILFAIGAKLTIQLPVFCSTPAFGIFNCSEDVQSQVMLVTRIDYIFGLNKFSGPASYPRNIGILPGILWDLLVLILLANVKSYLVMTGQWHYVRSDRDIHITPKFKSKYNQKTQREKEADEEELKTWKEDYPKKSRWQKFQFNVLWIGSQIKYFFLKLQPRYMNRIQPNRDLRSSEQEVTFNSNKVKPGRDYFNGNFFSLMIIFFYTLLFQKSITGAHISDESKAIDFDHFTVAQVIILLSLMLFMMVERMLYRTRKNSMMETPSHQRQADKDTMDWSKHTLTLKLILYIVLVIWVHIYTGFVMPSKQGIKLSKNIALLFNYLLWICHFAFAALQLKHGYPQAPYKTTFMRDTSFMTVMLFRVYRAIPFIWEMKVIIDWTVTHTCLDLFQWFRLDDAFNYVYFNKYQSDQRKSRREFEERHWTEKFFVGFCFAFGIILLILAPILLFSGINPTLVENPVKSGYIEISFELNNSGNKYQVFDSQAFNIRSLLTDEQQTFNSMYTPLDQEFEMKQMQRVQFTPYSQSNWVISYPSVNRLVQDFEQYNQNEDATFSVKSSWSFNRQMPTGKEITKSEIEVVLPLNTIQPFVDLIESEQTHDELEASIKVDNFFPKMLRLGQRADTSYLEVQPKEKDGFAPTKFFTVDLKLQRSKDGTLYWTFDVLQEDDTPTQGLFVDKQAKGFGDDLVILLYSDTVISSMLSSVMSMSVIGIYVTIVYAVGRFLRLMFDRYSQRAMYEELPETQKLFEICEGIFIAQLEGKLQEEKRLYDILIMIYRSPELMIKMTGYKQEHLQEKPTIQGADQNISGAPELVINSSNGQPKKKSD